MDKFEALLLEAETVSSLMINMADDDVGDTSFAVMSDLGENGTEHECDLGVHETALRASSVIDQLLAELEAKDKRIAEIEVSHKKLRETLAAVHNTITGGGAYTSLAGILTAVKRAYLESSDASARTVTVEGDE